MSGRQFAWLALAVVLVAAALLVVTALGRAHAARRRNARPRPLPPASPALRSPTGIWLTREAHARYEKAVAAAMRFYEEGDMDKYGAASAQADDILHDPRNEARSR